MSREGMDIGHDLGLLRLGCRAADTFADRDMHAGHLALEGAKHELAIPHQIEACPADALHCLEDERRSIRKEAVPGRICLGNG